MNKPLSSKTSKTDWDRINAMQDEDIDLSDIPEVTDAQMEGGVLRVGGRPVERGKQRVNMFLDNFVVEYFKERADEGGYQTLINAALVEYVQNHNFKEEL